MGSQYEGESLPRGETQFEQLKPVHYDLASEPDGYNLSLAKRDQLLETTAKAVNILLTLDSFDEAINTALKILGEGIGCDLMSVIENVFETPASLPTALKFIYAWATPELSDAVANLTSTCLPADFIGLTFMEDYFLQGSGFGGLLDDWQEPLRSWLASFQVQSGYTVPIRLNGQWWGVLCFDYCQKPIQLSTTEVTVLMMIADCIGSAIQRNRIQQERTQIVQQRAADLEQYNQVLLQRDRLLEVTAKATNVLLTLDDIDLAIDTALRILVEGTGCDRLKIMENIYDDSSPLPIRYTTIYKCLTPDYNHTHSHIDADLAAELNDAFKKYFLDGGGFGGLLQEWDEPLRSLFATLQIQSTCGVPVRVNGQWWGILCLDYCRAPIQISPAEVAVLRAAADCIGSAIQRDRAQKMLLQAEQARVAELVKANTVLKQSLDALAAEPDRDRFIGHILKLIAHQFDAPLIQYWVPATPDSGDLENCAVVYLTCWQGEIFRHPPATDLSQGLTPFLSIPLSLGEAIRGVLVIYLSSYRPVSGLTLELGHALAQQLTLAVELTRLAEEAQQSVLLQERTRLAREIHDTLAQAFGGVLMQLQAATYFATTQSDLAQTHLLTAQSLARDGLAEARRSVWTLYLETTEYEDPAQTIAKFIDQAATGQAAQIQLDINGVPYPLHPDWGLNLLRIAQEGITNALRHAQPQTIWVCLSYQPQTLQLMVCDDGCGFDPQSTAPGFGLLGMQQRTARLGATWHLSSQIGQGTTITVTLVDPASPKLVNRPLPSG